MEHVSPDSTMYLPNKSKPADSWAEKAKKFIDTNIKVSEEENPE